MKPKLLILWLAALPALAWAQMTVDNDDMESASVGLSKQLLCEVVAVGSGNIALLAGLLVALYGLWAMVRHAALKRGFILIISGALLTALPSLVISSLGGVATWLQNSGLSAYGDLLDVPEIVAKANNCAAIPVDFSGYKNLPSWTNAFNDPTGDPSVNPTTMNMGANTGGTMDPNAVTGQPGCTQLVDGGGPGSPFGPRTSVPTTNGRRSSSNHKGVDITCQHRDGPAIHAAAGGTVTYSGGRGGYGNSVIIDHGGGKVTTYNHMSMIDPKARLGSTVGGNDVIGYCGHTGNVTGPHLHFELKVNGVFKDPAANGCGG
jgi:hypothetical protein